ncbi:hypothetical protein [Haladaptatus sp. W1]|uniref:hypothetical protein n=1 Tax=Haladaptatus sp. W1 TaxID=1897478 RepID=UPI001112E892|nr:hypothetical protein [Haladaptatus sp. W1]
MTCRQSLARSGTTAENGGIGALSSRRETAFSGLNRPPVTRRDNRRPGDISLGRTGGNRVANALPHGRTRGPTRTTARRDRPNVTTRKPSAETLGGE